MCVVLIDAPLPEHGSQVGQHTIDPMLHLIQVRGRIVDQAIAVAKDGMILGTAVSGVECLEMPHHLLLVVGFKQEEREKFRGEIAATKSRTEQIRG